MDKMKTSWICPNCNEQVEEHFEACWNCQHNRDGVVPEGLLIPKEDRPPRTVAPNRICLRCQTNMTYAGKKDLHEGLRWGMLGDFAEWFVDQTTLEMYYCPACRHVEFFV